MRVRSAGGQGKATLSASFANVDVLKNVAVPGEWTVLRAPIAKALRGRKNLTLQSTGSVDVDWLWLPTSEEVNDFASVPRSLPITFANGARRALAAPTSRSLSFYLHPPKDAKLIVDVGSDQGATCTVKVQSESGEQELLHVKPDASTWQEQVVDLGKFADKPIRLELAVQTSVGKSGWGEPEIMIPGKAESPPTPKRAKNLVFILMDTTRADSFASVNPDTIVHTPVYDALAAKSTTFANAYNNENWTKPSVTTMWSALYPGTHGARQATSHVDASIHFMSEQLQDNGFTTAAFIANAVVSKTFGFDKGWTHFQNDSDSDVDGNGSKLYPHAAQWLEAHKDERFFLYVQSVDPHITYDVPKEYLRRYYKGTYSGQLGPSFDRDEQMRVDNGSMKVSDDDMAYVRALYHGEVSYQDHYIGALIKKIDELGLADDTLLVITNDHGEELRDHGTMGHGWPLFEEQLRAPLLMRYAPIFKPGASIKQVVEQVDLAPTILDALGVPPMKSAEGLSLLPLLSDGIGKRQHPFYAVSWTRKLMRSVRVGDWKLIAGKNSGWMYLYNLRNDPKEQHNLLKKGKTPPKEALLPGRLCEIYLGEALATPNKAMRMKGAGQTQRYNSPEISIDAKTRKQLEALGYL